MGYSSLNPQAGARPRVASLIAGPSQFFPRPGHTLHYLPGGRNQAVNVQYFPRIDIYATFLDSVIAQGRESHSFSLKPEPRLGQVSLVLVPLSPLTLPCPARLRTPCHRQQALTPAPLTRKGQEKEMAHLGKQSFEPLFAPPPSAPPCDSDLAVIEMGG